MFQTFSSCPPAGQSLHLSREISQDFDGLAPDFVQTFMVPSGWILMTLVTHCSTNMRWTFTVSSEMSWQLLDGCMKWNDINVPVRINCSDCGGFSDFSSNIRLNIKLSNTLFFVFFFTKYLQNYVVNYKCWWLCGFFKADICRPRSLVDNFMSYYLLFWPFVCWKITNLQFLRHFCPCFW